MRFTSRLIAAGFVLLLAGCTTRPAVDAGASVDLHGRNVSVGEVRLAPDVAARYPGAEQAALIAELRAALEEGFAPAAGEREAWRVAVDITSIDEVRPTVNALTALLLFVPMDMGGITFEARFTDANGSLVATLRHRERSTPFDVKGSFSRFGHARRALKSWAAQVVDAPGRSLPQ
jgi:hypothetical protein